jgi:hypothetical protein
MDNQTAPLAGVTAAREAAAEQTARLEAVRAAAARGDGAQTLRLARNLDPARTGPGIVVAVTNAALLEGSADDIAHAATIAIASPLRPRLRITIASQLVGAGHVLEGLAVLLADRASLADGEDEETSLQPVVLRLLQRAAQAGEVPPMLRGAMAALGRRMLGAADRRPEPAGIPFGPEGPRTALPGPPTMIRGGRDLPPPVAAEAESVMTGFVAATSRIEPPSVQMLRNVFVDRRGLVWDRHGRPVMTYQQPVPAAGLAAMATAPSVRAAVLAVEQHGNLYHWFAEWLPSLAWRLNDAAGTLPILLSDRAPAFVAQSLDLADAGAAQRIAVGDAIFVNQLFIGTRDMAFMAHRAAYGGLLERIAARADAMAGPEMASGPLYISRRDTTKRPMANEAALEAALAQRGFEPALFSEASVGHNIARLRRAPCVVAPHGAGLALLMAGRPDTRVVELVPATRGALSLRTCFARLSRLVGHRHVLWLERPGLMGGPWEADLPGVLAAVDTAAG